MACGKKKIKILFIGELISTHAQGWIDLVKDDDRFQVLGLLPGGAANPPNVSFDIFLARFSSSSKVPDILKRTFLKLAVTLYKPDIIHFFGLNPGVVYYGDAILSLPKHIKIIFQIRGGSDLRSGHSKETMARLSQLLCHCDFVISDNDADYGMTEKLGVPKEKRWPHGLIPGSAGIDLTQFENTSLPSQKKPLVVLPKAYEWKDCHGTLVLKAIQKAWPEIKGAKFIFAAVNKEMKDALSRVDDDLNAYITIFEKRIPRKEMLSYMKQARVVLAPSVLEGTPNTLYEAMASRAVPIYSPLESFCHHYEDEKNILYAANDDVDKIASSLIRALKDDELADMIARENVERVKHIADKRQIANNVQSFYDEICAVKPDIKSSNKND